MPNINDLISLANDEVGYLEKSRDSYELYGSECLYPKVKFAGADNYTKYSYELRNAGCGHPNGQYWCMTFICWLFFHLWGNGMADKLMCGMLSSASTMDTKNAMIKAGRQVPLNTAQAGDIVFRSRNGGGHVGLVVGRDSGKIVTIEGNTTATDAAAWNGGAVAKHTGGSWEWCCRPDWSLLPKEPEVWKWLHVGKKWYYQNQDGINSKGWKLIKETNGNYSHWYWFDQTGAAVTGWRYIDDRLYFFQPDGPLECAMCISDTTGQQAPQNVI